MLAHVSFFYTNFIHDCDTIFWLISIRISEYISAFSREMCGMTSTGSLLSEPLEVRSSPSSFFCTDLLGDSRDCGLGLFLEPFGRPRFRLIGTPSSSSWTGCDKVKFKAQRKYQKGCWSLLLLLMRSFTQRAHYRI